MRQLISNWAKLAGVALLLLATVTLSSLSCAGGNASQGIEQASVRKARVLTEAELAWLDSVSLQLYHCTRTQVGGGHLAFYMVGEFHIYDEATSRFADTLLAILQPGLFMTEGSDSASKSEFMREYSSSVRGFAAVVNRDYPELRKLALARGIPVVALENMDESTGVYEGVTESEKAFVAQAGEVFKAASANTRYPNFTRLAFENPKVLFTRMYKIVYGAELDTSKLESFEPLKLPSAFGPNSGIVDKRNELMSAKAIKYILPENGCILIRFGEGHSAGMIQNLEKSGCNCEPRSLREFLGASHRASTEFSNVSSELWLQGSATDQIVSFRDADPSASRFVLVPVRTLGSPCH